MHKNRKLNLSSNQEVPSSKIDEDYEKWLEEFVGSPTLNDLNKMEKMFSSTLPKNNPHYYPIQGA